MADGGYFDVKCRVNGVLEKLKDCSEELQEIERVMTDGSSEDRSDLQSTVREMLGALETGLKRVPENQEESESRSKRMRSRRGAGPGICTHTCVHHPEIVNPGLWSKLTDDLVGLVFARLPIPRIIELRKSSAPWAAMSESASFKSAFASSNPKLFGLLGWDDDVEHFHIRILDAAFKEWHAIELEFPKEKRYRDFFPQGKGYRDSLYASDGGLVCLVPEWTDDECFDCVFVGNPLTDAWRKLPDIPLGFGNAVLVQLLTNEFFYRVILVYSEKLNNQDAETYGAFVYDSRARSWSVMNSGLVYGSGKLFLGLRNDPLVFDCTTKRLIYLGICAAVEDLEGLRCSALKDRLFVLHVLINPDLQGDDTKRYVISEFMWESSRSDLRKVNEYEVALRGVAQRHDVEIFTSTGFILSIWDNEPEYGSVHQLIRIYDVSAGQWRDLPLIGDSRSGIESLELLFMCELRWDANP